MKKRKTINKLIKEADDLFSKYIRKRDNYKCISCGTYLEPSESQCGHLITRRKKAVRWDEYNCHCQCPGCNYKHNFYPHIMTIQVIKKIGQMQYEDLCSRTEIRNFRPTREFLGNIIDKYKLSEGNSNY